MPLALKRPRHLRTVFTSMPSWSAISQLLEPRLAHSTMLALNAPYSGCPAVPAEAWFSVR